MVGKYNVELLEVNHMGWPLLFVVACQDIKKGAELLLEYGEGHWTQVASAAELEDLTSHWESAAAEKLRKKIARCAERSDNDTLFAECEPDSDTDEEESEPQAARRKQNAGKRKRAKPHRSRQKRAKK